MKILRKTIWTDGQIIPLPPEEITVVDDPDLKTHGKLRVTVYDQPKQEIFGFGGAFTEASAHNYALLPPDEKQKALELLFGAEGLNYRFCRVCLGSCDFSLSDYRYASDETLADFSIDHDRAEIIPFIRDAQSYRGGDLVIFASPWSPPAFFKTTGSVIGGHLRDDCYEKYAEYFALFIEAYAREGIRVSYVTPQNEPGLHRWEGCIWSDGEMARLVTSLGEAFARHGLDTRILAWDYNRAGMFDHVRRLMRSPAARYVGGVGFHWYNGIHTGELDATHDIYPELPLIETEFCHGLGARMYGRYRTELMDVLGHHANAVVEWNLLLNAEGGPYHNRDIGCNSPVWYDAESGEVKKRSIYSQMYLFSHFIQPGARVLYTSAALRDMMTLAVRNPDGHVLIYLYNNSHEDAEALMVWEGEYRWHTAAPAGCLVLWELAGN